MEKHYDRFGDLGTVLSLFAQNKPEPRYRITVCSAVRTERYANCLNRATFPNARSVVINLPSAKKESLSGEPNMSIA
jgi:hypothetical protein